MTDIDHDKMFSRLISMMEILIRDKSTSLKEFAEMYNVNIRTIRRDVKRLSFFPIELKRGIIYIEESYGLDRPDLNTQELLLTELALSAIHGIDDVTDKRVHSIRAKLTNPLYFTPYNIKAETYEEMNKNSEITNKIEDAITKRNLSKVTSNDIVCVVQPYKVVAFDGIWYLLAKDMADKKIKTFLMSQIQEFNASTKVFSTSYVDIDALLENVHTAWFEDGNSFNVKVKIKKEIAHYFKLKNHLSSQKIIKENSDGSILVTFDVSSDEDVDNLIKSWLPHIEVISPTRFKKRLVSELEEYLKELQNTPTI